MKDILNFRFILSQTIYNGFNYSKILMIEDAQILKILYANQVNILKWIKVLMNINK